MEQYYFGADSHLADLLPKYMLNIWRMSIFLSVHLGSPSIWALPPFAASQPDDVRIGERRPVHSEHPPAQRPTCSAEKGGLPPTTYY